MKKSEGGAASAAPVRSYAIDALRTIAVCLVIYIHIFAINPGLVYSQSTSWKAVDVVFALARLAVPVFFAISGWYVYTPSREERVIRLRRQIPRLVYLIIIATVGTALALWILSHLKLADAPPAYIPDVPSLFEMFTLGKSPGIAPLWFLSSLIIVETVYLLSARAFRSDRWLAVAGFAFFALSLAFGSYRQVIGLPAVPFSINETWFLGFAWFTTGYFSAKYFRGTAASLSTRTVTRFYAISSALYFYEYILHTSGTPFVLGPYNYEAVFLFTPFIIIAVLVAAARSNWNGPYIKALAYAGRKYSLGVFIIHVVIIQPVGTVFGRLGLLSKEPVLHLVFTYGLVVMISFGLTAAYYTVRDRIRARIQ